MSEGPPGTGGPRYFSQQPWQQSCPPHLHASSLQQLQHSSVDTVLTPFPEDTSVTR